MNENAREIVTLLRAILSVAFGFGLLFLAAVLLKPLLDIGVGLYILIIFLAGVGLMFEKLRQRIRGWIS